MSLLKRIFFVTFFISFSVNANPHLLVFTESSPPYQTLENGKVSGLATDKVKRLVELAKLEADFFMYPWARAEFSVSRSTRALIYSIAKTPERIDKFHWIMPVAEFNLAFITLASNKPIVLESWDDLKHYSVAVQRGDIGERWLNKQGLVEGDGYLSCADIQCSWYYLLSGKVDMIIEDPNLVGEMTRNVGLTPEQVKTVKVIPDLSVVGYLAANRDMDEALLNRLKNAAKQTTKAQ